MNPAHRSKINWMALALQMIGIGAIMNWYPPAIEKQVTEIALIVGPTLIQVARTWFTGDKA